MEARHAMAMAMAIMGTKVGMASMGAISTLTRRAIFPLSKALPFPPTTYLAWPPLPLSPSSSSSSSQIRPLFVKIRPLLLREGLPSRSSCRPQNPIAPSVSIRLHQSLCKYVNLEAVVEQLEVDGTLLLRMAVGDLNLIELIETVEVYVVLCNDEYIQNLNKECLGEDFPTDVLFIPQDRPHDFTSLLPLGNVVISVESALRKVEERGHGLRDELRILLLHGLLRMFGYHHKGGSEEARKMEDLENQILDSLKWKRKAFIGSLVQESFKNSEEMGSCSEDTGQYQCHREERVYTATDVSQGVLDVCGWTVVFEGERVVGQIEEVLQMENTSYFNSNSEGNARMLRVVQVYDRSDGKRRTNKALESRRHDLFVPKDNNFGMREILVPAVDDFIREIDASKKRLLIKPSSGLLELAKRPEILRTLQPAILEFCMQNKSFLKKRFTNKRFMKNYSNFTSNEEYIEDVLAYMPTRDQLQDAGRFDLIRQIKAAGGFLFVAHALNLKSTRRPDGFWEDSEMLDVEIRKFISDSWMERTHKESGKIYYENQITKVVSLFKPKSSVFSEILPENDEALKIMPRRKDIEKAGRWDLHHAIIRNGGYREVAKDLCRKMVKFSDTELKRRILILESLLSGD